MAHRDFPMPMTEAQVRSLRVNDTVTLGGTLFGIRDGTQIHMFDRGRKTRFDLRGHAVIHTAPNVKVVDKSEEFPAGYEPICVGTTTSDRMERFTRPLMQEYGVRLIIGKGGLRDDSLAAFADLGGAYLAIIGGTAALETNVDRSDRRRRPRRLNRSRCGKFRVRSFGPLLVAMDSHRASPVRRGEKRCAERRAEALRKLGVV
jgi:L(+)-tartrate dehydratase beta subunit